MRKTLYLSRIFLLAFLLVWGLYTKAHPGYDMVLCGKKIGYVKNKTQAEDILEIIRHETQNRDIPASLYLRLFRLQEPSDAARLLENAREAAEVYKHEPEEKPPQEAVAAVSAETQKTAFSSPIQSAFVSSPFGMRGGRMHEGVDLAAEHGSPIYAASNGTVTFSGAAEGYGNLIILSHENGYETYYAHCSELFLSLGDHAAEGTVIAAVGSTGKSTGPHLHFEIRKDGTPEDPFIHLENKFT